MDSKHYRHHAGSNTGRKVRVVAKVRGFSGPEPDFPTGSSRTVDWISVNKPEGENSEGVTISFGEQSSSQYFVDYCYEQHEENELIYSIEVKPLISSVFEGHNSSVIACGARGSGKTHLIQGSAEKPGLAVHAIAEFLSMAEENGKSIAISFYEVDHQEHAVDLLNPEQTPVLVYEDRGKIMYKGLSQIPVKSIVEFQNLYLTACSAQKEVPKKGYERPRRSHRGLIVHVFSQNIASKMTFVDLGGYEDARKKSSYGTFLAETNKIHKSIHALLNVSHALSTNESRVPYRESKLTRMLQDSLRGTSRILIVACLNPSICQDTIYMLSLASRSCQSVQRAALDSTKKSVSSVRQIVTSHKSQIPKSVSTTAKKMHGPRSYQSEKKASVPMKSAIKGRKLFDEASHSAAKAEKEISMTQTSSEPPLDNSLEKAGDHVEPNPRVEKDNSFTNATHDVKLNLMVKNGISLNGEDHEEAINCSEAETMVEEGNDMNKENSSLTANEQGVQAVAVVPERRCHNMNKENNLMANEIGFPSISAQLRELSNSLKLLCSTTPLSVEIPSKEPISVDGLSADIVEPKTPVIEQAKNLIDNRMDVVNAKSPRQSISVDGLSTDIVEPKTPVIEQAKSLFDNRMDVVNAKSPRQNISVDGLSTDIVEPKTPVIEQAKNFNDSSMDVKNAQSPWQTFSMRGSGMKDSLVQEYLRFLNTANKEDLKKLKGIGERRATLILDLRDESPEPFKSLDDLKDIGLSAKQIKGMVKKEIGELLFC